jgi:hypothetical protein
MDSIFINTKFGKRKIDWGELHQLKKDILWIYDENAGGMKDPYVPFQSFNARYWEFVTLHTDKILSDHEIKFYKQGALIITLCMAVEFMDTIGGDQQLFGDVSINEVMDYINAFEPIGPDEIKLKETVVLSLSIIGSMTEYDKRNSFGFTHPDMETLDQNLEWVDTTFVKSYFNL